MKRAKATTRRGGFTHRFDEFTFDLLNVHAREANLTPSRFLRRLIADMLRTNGTAQALSERYDAESLTDKKQLVVPLYLPAAQLKRLTDTARQFNCSRSHLINETIIDALADKSEPTGLKPLTKVNSKRKTVRLSPLMSKDAHKQAASLGLTFSEYVAQCLKQDVRIARYVKCDAKEHTPHES